MEKFFEKMAELADRLGPNVVEAARGATRIEAYSSMMGGAVGAVLCIIAVVIGRRLWSIRDKDDDLCGLQIFAFILWIFAAIVAIPSVWSFVDPWIWTAINNPDLYIAKKLLKL